MAITGRVLQSLESVRGLDIALIREQPSPMYRLQRKTRRVGMLAVLRDLYNQRNSPSRYYSGASWGSFRDEVSEHRVARFERVCPQRVLRTADIQSTSCLRTLDERRFDVLCLIDAGGIVRDQLLKRFTTGIINAHGGGRLPEVRGSDALEWSIWETKQPWVNTHFVDLGIDTGPILLQVPMKVGPRDTMASLYWRRDELRAQLLADTVRGLHAGEVRPSAQDLQVGRTFYRMHPYLMGLLPGRLERLKEYIGVDGAIGSQRQLR